MCDSTSDVVYQSVLSGMPCVFASDAESIPETTAPVQYFENSHPSSSCFYDADPRLVLDPTDSRSIGTIPDNNCIQHVTAQWHASPMEEGALPSASNEVVSYWSKMQEYDFTMKYHPALMVPSVAQIRAEGLGTETLYDKSGISSFFSPISPKEPEESTSASVLQAGNPSPSQECYTLWKKIPVDAIVVTGTKRFVPQRLYRPFTEADKERYLEQTSLSMPIVFVTKEPVEWGISLEEIRNGKAQRLVDKDDPVLQDRGPSISIRINWPGYPPFKRQISSRNWRKMKGPITKKKLAQNLLKTTGRFIEQMSKKPLEAGAEKSWKVGPRHIKVEDLILVSLHHVSKGSWQPQFRLRRDFMT